MNLSELQHRIGDVEQRVVRSGQSSSDYLRQLQERLAIIQEHLVQQNAEVEVKQREVGDLKQENTELRKLLDRLLGVIEIDAVAALDSGLKAFEGQVDALVELTSDAPGAVASNGTPTGPAETFAARKPETEASQSDDPDRQWAEDFLRRVCERNTESS